MSNFYVYILSCSDGSTYTGQTENLDQRINSHLNGTGSLYVKNRRPAKLIWFTSGIKTRNEAIRIEKEIKSLGRTGKLALASSQNLSN